MRNRGLSLLVLLQCVACSDSSSGAGAAATADASASTMQASGDSGASSSRGSSTGAGESPNTEAASVTRRDPSTAAPTSSKGDGAAKTADSPEDAAVKPAQNAKDAAASNETPDADPPPRNCVGTKPLDAFVSDPKLCVYTFAEDVRSARQMAFASNGDLFVSGGSKVTVLWDEDGDGFSSASERAVFAEQQGLNHGLAFSLDRKFLYASSASGVFRWAFADGDRVAGGSAQTVIRAIPGGGHATRTLAFDSKGRLYVSVGSASNVDSAQNDIELRSQIRRYELPASIPSDGLAYDSGEVIASGMRNEVGMYIDDRDRLWGVENGRDNLDDADLGGDIHNDNPGEELNLVDGEGSKFYGYPSCFTEHTIAGGKGGGQGTQWADQSSLVVGSLRKTDEFCKDPEQVHPPVYAMPAHWAPLGIIQYTGRSLPYAGDLIIGAHGSWNRSPATGRVIARAKLEGDKVSDFEVIVGEKNAQGELVQGSWDVRPVDLQQGPDQAVYFSDDNGRRVLKIGYQR